jgi:hypothetical protein
MTQPRRDIPQRRELTIGRRVRKMEQEREQRHYGTGGLIGCWCGDGPCRYSPPDRPDDALCWRHGKPVNYERSEDV